MDQTGQSLLQAVTGAARDRLRRSPYASIRRVSCEFDAGVLFLRGPLPSFYHKQLAQAAVADLAGVTEVANETEVVILDSRSPPVLA